jgi:hypothetical protein
MKKKLYYVLELFWTTIFCPIIAISVYIFAIFIISLATILNRIILKQNHKTQKNAKAKPKSIIAERVH